MIIFHAAGGPSGRAVLPASRGGITINEMLTKEAFQERLCALLPDAAAGAAEIWVDFAHECVRLGQYVDFESEPEETAMSRWYDTLLAGFVLLKRDFGETVATRICDMSLDNRCLYPYEMQRAGQDLRDGGSVDTLFRLMEEDRLAASPPIFPKLRDVMPQAVPDMTLQL